MHIVVYAGSSKLVCWEHSKEALLIASMRNVWLLGFLGVLFVCFVGWLGIFCLVFLLVVG